MEVCNNDPNLKTKLQTVYDPTQTLIDKLSTTVPLFHHRLLQPAINAEYTKIDKDVVSYLVTQHNLIKKELPMSEEIVLAMVVAGDWGTKLPYKTIFDGYLICIKRIMRFVEKIGWFQGFCAVDKHSLLFSNTNVAIAILSTEWLNPKIELKEQMKRLSGIDTDVLAPNSEHHDTTSNRLNFHQVYSSPWTTNAEDERQYHFLIQTMLMLPTDEITVILLSVIALYSNDKLPLYGRKMADNCQKYFA